MAHMSNRPRLDRLDALRRRIRAMERRPASDVGAGLATAPPRHASTPATNPTTNPGDLISGAGRAGELHEIAPVAHGDSPSAIGFAAAHASRLANQHAHSHAPIVWAQTRVLRHEFGRLYGPGLANLGLNPQRLLLMDVAKDMDVLWALEEALRSGACAAVIGHLGHASFTATRRLALAAATTQTSCLLLTAPGRAGSTAARTRWRISAAPSAPHTLDTAAPGTPRWRAELVRVKDAQPGAWLMERDDATGVVGLVAGVAARPAAPRPAFKESRAVKRAATG